MKKIKFCPECMKETKQKKVIKGHTFNIKGQAFITKLKKWVCYNCSNENIEDEVYDKGLKRGFEEFNIERKEDNYD